MSIATKNKTKAGQKTKVLKFPIKANKIKINDEIKYI